MMTARQVLFPLFEDKSEQSPLPIKNYLAFFEVFLYNLLFCYGQISTAIRAR